MRKKIIPVLLILLALFAVGCPRDEAPTVTTKAFVGGTAGLEIGFLEGAPPSEVFDADFPFQISVRIENRGEHNIDKDAIITITGINPADFGVSSAQLTTTYTEEIQGVEIDGAGNVISGDFVTIDFPTGDPSTMDYQETVSGAVQFTIRANICYEYKTVSQGKLCVREDLRGVTGTEGICEPNRQIPAENSGSPIQITNFRQNVAGSNKIDFFFKITNMGKLGDSLHKEGTSCDTNIPERDVVLVDVKPTDIGEIVCSGLKDGTATSGYITLFNGEREIRCTQTVDDLRDFETTIDIDLTYGYKQFIDTQINVRHSPG